MSSLNERLKQIRATQRARQTIPSTQPDRSSPPHHDDACQGSDPDVRSPSEPATEPRGARPREDEIESLLRAMRHVVAIESSQHAREDSYGSHMSNDSSEMAAWLADCTTDTDGQARNEEDADKVDERLVRAMARQTERFTEDAERAMRELRQDGSIPDINRKEATVPVQPTQDTTSRLVVERKDRPMLIRNASMEDDLADAMGLSTDNSEGGPVRESQQSQPDLVTEKEEDLRAILAKLRDTHILSPSKRLEGPNDVDSLSTGLLDLPNAPKERLSPASKTAGEGRDEWRVRHGVEGRDLSAFAELARLDATKLAAPSEKPKASSYRETQASRDTDDDPDRWCCICNEDAVVACTGCDDDLYCQACWNEGHDPMDEDERREHRRKTIISTGQKRPLLAA